MDNNSNGPYKHYERPDKPRTSRTPKNSGKGWGTVICILILVLVVMIPVAHKLSSNNHQEKAKEVETVKSSKNSTEVKSSTSSKKVKKIKKNTNKNKVSSKVNTQISSSSSSSSVEKNYVVKEGDTLSGIANSHGMTVAQLAELNGISDSESVEAGQTLKLK